MKAVVIYQSLWGNTAAIARAIAEGIGGDARAVCTDEATPEVVSAADLVVAGAPLLAFSLPTDGTLENIRKDKSLPPPDLGHPSMREWIAELPRSRGRCAAFETRFKWSPGSAAKTIAKGLRAAGYESAAKPEAFLVTGRFGPLKPGEVDRARAWGARLAQSID